MHIEMVLLAIQLVHFHTLRPHKAPTQFVLSLAPRTIISIGMELAHQLALIPSYHPLIVVKIFVGILVRLMNICIGMVLARTIAHCL